jgi:hypothetical protein
MLAFAAVIEARGAFGTAGRTRTTRVIPPAKRAAGPIGSVASGSRAIPARTIRPRAIAPRAPWAAAVVAAVIAAVVASEFGGAVGG